MTVTLSRKLNLVIPVQTESGMLYVHASPVGREVFDRFFMVFAQTFSGIYNGGLGTVAGPRIAHRMLKQVARDLGVWAPPAGSDAEPGLYAQLGLVGEMHRLTNVVMGSDLIPLEEAASRRLLDEDDLDEVEGAICFFTVASRMHMKKDLPGVMAGLTHFWGAEPTSLGPMEYVRSLPTPTEVGTTGETATA